VKPVFIYMTSRVARIDSRSVVNDMAIPLS